jgi:mannose-6-phosphate isomerase class I
MVDGAYFQTFRHKLNDTTIEINTDGNFHGITCILGTIRLSHPIESFDIEKGQTAFVPANLEKYALSGNGVVLRSMMK